jgi:hypothetical protein
VNKFFLRLEFLLGPSTPVPGANVDGQATLDAGPSGRKRSASASKE